MGSVFPQRKSPRLIGYDYTLAGAYFVTIFCSHERTHLFRWIQNAIMVLNSAGESQRRAGWCFLNIILVSN